MSMATLIVRSCRRVRILIEKPKVEKSRVDN